MADLNKDPTRVTVKKIVFNALKATIKGVIFYLIYMFAWSFLSPLAAMVPGLQQAVEAFVIVYITLMIIGQLTSGTIYEHFFNTAKALFVIGFLMMSLKSGIFSASFENMTFLIDLRLFIVLAMLLSLLGLAKAVMQAISFINQKAEYAAI